MSKTTKTGKTVKPKVKVGRDSTVNDLEILETLERGLNYVQLAVSRQARALLMQKLATPSNVLPSLRDNREIAEIQGSNVRFIVFLAAHINGRSSLSAAPRGFTNFYEALFALSRALLHYEDKSVIHVDILPINI